MNEFQTLVFLGLRGVGRVTVKNVLESQLLIGENIQDQECLDIISEVAPSIGGKLKPEDIYLSKEKAEKTLGDCERLGIVPISYSNDLYPSQLKDLDKKAPMLLFAKGDLSVLASKKNAAVIGTRNITPEGVKAGSYITSRLVEEGYVIVSGLAKGCDTVGHSVCLDNGGRTIAVLATGIDVIYPKENTELAKRITDDGCLLSEYPPGTGAMANRFIERDRIQSGLSKGIVVVETNVKGGTMHTVEFALSQKRRVACIRYNDDVLSPSNAGNRMLIDEKKAFPLTSRNVEEYVHLLEDSMIDEQSVDQQKLDFN